MVDGFDFDLGLDGFGLDGFGADAIGFAGPGFGFGGFDGLAGFDPMMAGLDGMGMQDLGGFGELGAPGMDLAGMDLAGFELDLAFDSVGLGSDLDDVLLAPDMGHLIDLDLAGPLDGQMTLDDALSLGPQSVPGLSPMAAMGPGPLASPFLSVDAGGAAMGGGAFAAGVGSSILVPGDPLSTPIDSFRFPARSTATVVTKAVKWLGGKSGQLAEQLAMEVAATQIKRGAGAVFATLRGAERANA